MDEKNEFFSYAIEEAQDGFNVVVYDLYRNGHDVLFTKSEALATYLENYFDNLSMYEEIELFKEVMKNG